ncbi:MAG: YkgJ family cysteine cluster protein [Pseudomonadota bacterium]
MNQSIPIKTETTNRCELCTQSKCCRYITQSIDTPRSIRDFDTLLWQVSHKNIAVYKDESGWYLQIFNSCEHLKTNGQCGIYDVRPFICREYSNEDCEFDSEPDDGCDLYFPDYQSLDAYCRKRYKRWDKRFDK